jgi:hypothetical protein
MQKFVLAPTGSKMQAVAVGIIRTYLDDIQIAYPTINIFSNPSDYTHGVKQMYLLPLSSYDSFEC